MTTPAPLLPNLYGVNALQRTPSLSANRSLPSLQGGLTQQDLDIRDVVNAAVAAVDVSATTGALMTIATVDVTAGNVALNTTQAAADVIMITGTPGVSRTITFPVAATFTRPNGTPVRLINLSNAVCVFVDPWVNTTPSFPIASIVDCVWYPTGGVVQMIAYLGGATSLGLDQFYGNTRGMILYRGASGWAALAPGTTGQVLTATTGGDPHWA